jgi:hypothetical protein
LKPAVAGPRGVFLTLLSAPRGQSADGFGQGSARRRRIVPNVCNKRGARASST